MMMQRDKVNDIIQIKKTPKIKVLSKFFLDKLRKNNYN